MKDIKKITRIELEDENIFVLRQMAKDAGIPYPDDKNKQTLVAELFEFYSAEMSEEEQRLEELKPKEVEQPKVREPLPPLSPHEPYTGENSIVPNELDISHLQLSDSVTPDKCIASGIFEKNNVMGYGFIRAIEEKEDLCDIYVSKNDVEDFGLRTGDRINGVAFRSTNEKAPALHAITSCNYGFPDRFNARPKFDKLVPCFPYERIVLEDKDELDDASLRFIDLFIPLGKGQRGLIVAPPKTGKTTLLKQIAQTIEKKYPKVKLFVLLVDERPEEVTDFKRSIESEVFACTFDQSSSRQIRTTELIIEYMKRLVEENYDVVLLIDSITRLTRAYNSVITSSGKTLSGGLDPAAVQATKKIFGAARKTENAGSLTILATALVETGSRLDDVVYEEFKGTGNMEICLSRELAERRVFPPIDIFKSGTRKEELLLSKNDIIISNKLRSILRKGPLVTEEIIEIMKKAKTKKDLVVLVNQLVAKYN